MCNITINKEKNGIELRFDSKPEESVLNALKENGFRWSSKQKMWYAKYNDERAAFANTLDSSETNKTEKDGNDVAYDLFELTRVDQIPSNVDKSLNNKEIAALIRAHIKQRFPMCKISVRSDRGSIDFNIVSSPFAKGSDELNAIAKYFEAYVDSFRYCTCYDPYGDYGSSYNFYGGYRAVDYNYAQSEMTDVYTLMAERFQSAKAEFEDAEELRMQKEFETQMKEDEERREKARIANELREADHAKVEANVTVNDLPENVQYFVEDLLDYQIRKMDAVEEYQEKSEEKDATRCVCKVCREVHMSEECYSIFSNQLMDDWSFIAGTGGSRTEDRRINSMVDYNNMCEEERKTVEWYSCDCVAVFCEDKLMMVVDAQGFGYCRYVFFADDSTSKSLAHRTNQVLSVEDYEHYKELADELYSTSAEIILRNDWVGKWCGECSDAYRREMIDWIENNDFEFDVNVVRAITEDMEHDFKVAMYRVLTEINGIQHQFMRALIKPGQRITMVKISDFGGLTFTRATFDSFECGRYAQYDKAVKLVVRPERKKNLHYAWLYNEVLIYDGWIEDMPEDMLYDIETRPGVTVKRTKYASFDHAQYDIAMEYMRSKGARMLVNTYKPGAE